MSDAHDVQVVYHYTSADTLLKIVSAEPERIWATHLRYLNDVSESDHCLNLLRQRLPEFLRLHNPRNGYFLEAAFAAITGERYDEPFVASFSALRDSLPQWRSYCPNGNGVSIGFHVAALRLTTLTRELMYGSFPPFKSTLERIQYLSSDDLQAQDSILSNCLKELDQWNQEQDDAPEDERESMPPELVLESIISRKASLVKHSAFENEREYRLLAPSLYHIGKGAVKFRCSRTTVIPYVEVLMPEWGKSKTGPPKFSPTYNDYFLHEIVIGPTPNPKLTKNALSLLFGGKSVPVNVKKSSIPYRDL
jgi:hypothetical protein